MDNAYLAGKKLLRGSYSSYTPTGASYFKQAGAWYTVPQPGYVVYFYNSSLKRIGHVGIVLSVDTKKKTFRTRKMMISFTMMTAHRVRPTVM